MEKYWTEKWLTNQPKKLHFLIYILFVRMKNLIADHIDMSRVPLSVRKTFHIDDFLIKNEVVLADNGEKLVTIDAQNPHVRIAPFWEDAPGMLRVDDRELQDIIDLEWVCMHTYVQNHPDFGIQVRETVYKKICEANTLFQRAGVELVIKIGYRPAQVQRQLFSGVWDYMTKKYSDLPKEKIYALVCEFVSDVDTFTSPHVTGGALDAVLRDISTTKELDMGSPINYPDVVSYYTYADISPEARKNRDFFCDTMLSVGFANLASEWWHFSYGDPHWAYFYGKKESLYSMIA